VASDSQIGPAHDQRPPPNGYPHVQRRAAGKAYGARGDHPASWELDDQYALDALADVGVRTVEKLGPERAAYWWYRGFYLTAPKAKLILPES
jgi:hypothetical protein